MAKQAGMGDNLWVAGRNVSGDIGSLSRIGGGPAALVTTGIDKSAHERLGGLRDGGLEFTSFFNDATNQAFDLFSDLPTTDVIGSYLRGTTLGNWAASVVAKQANYDGTRNQDGSLTFATSLMPNGYGLEWGKQLTAGMRTDTGAASGTGVDFGAGASFGLQAWLHVLSFSGTDVTVKIQESSDNSGDAYADVVGGGFTQITGSAPLAQRIQTARNLAVERYLRVTTVTTGGFTDLKFVVIATLNATEVLF
jgi:hypothetical protein